MDQNQMPAAPSAQPLAKKHMRSFWPLTIIFVVAVILAGLIYWFQFNLSTDYDLQSMVITVHPRDLGPKQKTQESQTGQNAQSGTATSTNNIK